MKYRDLARFILCFTVLRLPVTKASLSRHICSIRPNGELKCWGRGDWGRLGNGQSSGRIGDVPGEMGDNLSAVNLGTGQQAVSVATGEHHTCAILKSGKVSCWGYGALGALGNGLTEDIGDSADEMGDNLFKISFGAGRKATELALGGLHTCVLVDNGTVCS